MAGTGSTSNSWRRPPSAAAWWATGEFWHDTPIPVAGRAVGTFGAVDAADRLLSIAAGPAVFYANRVTYLAWPGDEDVGLSYVVAGVAFVLSTAFWLAAGNGLAARLERRRALTRGLRIPG